MNDLPRDGRTTLRDALRFAPVIVIAAVIFVLTSIPGDELPYLETPIGTDKLVHVGLYAVLGAAAAVARGDGSLSPWIVWLFCVVYGVGDELHQAWIPGRTVSVWDWSADAAGAGLGVIAVLWWRAKRRARKQDAEQRQVR